MKNSFTKNALTSLFDNNSISEIMMQEKQDGLALVGVWHGMAALAFADPEDCVRLTPHIAMDAKAVADYFRIPEALAAKAIGWLKKLGKLTVTGGALQFTAEGKGAKELTIEQQEHFLALNRQRVARCRARKKKGNGTGGNERAGRKTPAVGSEKQEGDGSGNGNNRNCNGNGNGSVMHPVMAASDGTKQTRMGAATGEAVTEDCNAPVMAVRKEKRKNQRKEGHNDYINIISQPAILALPACPWEDNDKTETLVMGYEADGESENVISGETPAEENPGTSSGEKPEEGNNCFPWVPGEENATLPLEKLPTPLRTIAEAWNRLQVNAITGLSASLRKKAGTLLSSYSLETITGAIAGVAKSPFLLGQKGSGKWKTCLGWLLKPENFAKVLAGKYLDKPYGKDRAGYNGNGFENCGSRHNGSTTTVLWGAKHRLPFYLPGEGDEEMTDEEYEIAIHRTLHPDFPRLRPVARAGRQSA